MSLGTFIVIAVAAAFGYWCVSSLMNAMEQGARNKHHDGARSGGNENWQTGEQNNYQNDTAKSDPDKMEWYETLGVPESATFEEATQAYKGLIRKYHPDKVSTLGDEFKAMAEEKSKQINAAYAQARALRRGY